MVVVWEDRLDSCFQSSVVGNHFAMAVVAFLVEEGHPLMEVVKVAEVALAEVEVAELMKRAVQVVLVPLKAVAEASFDPFDHDHVHGPLALTSLEQVHQQTIDEDDRMWKEDFGLPITFQRQNHVVHPLNPF